MYISGAALQILIILSTSGLWNVAGSGLYSSWLASSTSRAAPTAAVRAAWSRTRSQDSSSPQWSGSPSQAFLTRSRPRRGCVRWPSITGGSPAPPMVTSGGALTSVATASCWSSAIWWCTRRARPTLAGRRSRISYGTRSTKESTTTVTDPTHLSQNWRMTNFSTSGIYHFRNIDWQGQVCETCLKQFFNKILYKNDQKRKSSSKTKYFYFVFWYFFLW